MRYFVIEIFTVMIGQATVGLTKTNKYMAHIIKQIWLSNNDMSVGYIYPTKYQRKIVKTYFFKK